MGGDLGAVRAVRAVGGMPRHALMAKMFVLAVTGAFLCAGSRPDDFSRIGKQDSLQSMRMKAGTQMSTRARDGVQTDLGGRGKRLLSSISAAGDRSDWQTVNRLYSSYNGTETQIFNAVLHLACKCGKYEQGARIYEHANQLNVSKNALTLTAALAIHAELNETHAVRQIWTESLQTCKLDEPLAQARIAAAAAEGDITSAAEVLDIMIKDRVNINNAHITSAIRACWEAKGNYQNAAEHLFNLSIKLGLQPEIPSFTCLMGAYRNANLTRISAAYSRMKDFGVEPNRAFAEVYLIAVLQVTKDRQIRSVSQALRHLRMHSADRLAAAQQALRDFRRADVEVSNLCSLVERGFEELGA